MRKRLAVFFFVLLLALVGISVQGGPVTWTFLWLVLLLPLFSILYIGYVILFLKIYQRTDGRNMVSGTPADFYVTLQNEGPFSFSALRIKYYSSFSTIMDLKEDVVYELPPGASIRRTTQLLCRYRGEYQVGIKKITVWDPLGLFSFPYTIREPLTVIVAPALLQLQHPGSIAEFSYADHDSFENRTEPDVTVREYMPGDPLRSVHWKSTAVMQKLMIREKIGEEKSGIGIYMESHRYDDRIEEYLPVENRIIETTLALSEYFMRNFIPVDVLLQKEQAVCKTIRDTSGFEELYQEMFAYAFRKDRSMLRMLAERSSQEMAAYRLLIFIVHHWGAEEETWVEQHNTAHAPVVIYEICRDAKREADAVTDRREISLRRIGIDGALQEVL